MDTLGVSKRQLCPGDTNQRPLQNLNVQYRAVGHRFGTRTNIAVNVPLSSRQKLTGRKLVHRGRPVLVRAVAAPDVAKVYEKEFPLGTPHNFKVSVVDTDGGEQVARFETDHPGRLLLHWGVEGGRGYRGGWRLPPPGSRPEGSVQYKDRAIQTPWREISPGKQMLDVKLTRDEASDFLVFVIKDEATNAWYEYQGTNYKIPLRSDSTGSMAEALKSIDVDIPAELCGIWAYIKWEVAGCPTRSQNEADAEYQHAIQEVKSLLMKGRPLEELWKVARGQIKYQEYVAYALNGSGPSAPSAPSKPAQAKAAPVEPPKPTGPPPPYVPDDLVAVEAYILWEKAGRPQGADFGEKARKTLQDKLRAGSTIADLEKELRAPPAPPPPAPAQKRQQQQQAQPAQVPSAPAPPAPATIGGGLEVRSRNAISMIKSKAPQLKRELSLDPQKPLKDLTQLAAIDDTTVWYRVFELGSKSELLAVVRQPDGPEGPTTVILTTDQPNPVVMHWGVRQGKGSEWLGPPGYAVPQGSQVVGGGKAAETDFVACNEEECLVEMEGSIVPLQRVELSIPNGHDLSGLTFVLRSTDGTRWWRDGGSNYNVPVPGGNFPMVEDTSYGFDDHLSKTIIDCECNSSAWTLMHRFNKAADLLGDAARGDQDQVTGAMVKIYVWLRYSAIRQLTWQRNYNTQPRILGAAQSRLTYAIAEAHAKTSGEAQEWARLMLTTVGRGGNAQAVRDEILNIMHRNKIPELKGTWMEEWHQKLHNNTTPDDVGICEAYLAFLRSNGDQGQYWRVLTDAGITRQRLTSFDRAIVCDPHFYADKKDSLIREFQNYLGILKAVHSGADLQASVKEAGNMLPGAAKGWVGYVLSHVNDSQILPLIQAAVEARAEIQPALNGNRELLYLDLALENVIRAAAERGAGATGTGAAPLIGPLLLNLIMSVGDNEELCFCLNAWDNLPQAVREGRHPTKDQALKTMAVLDRVRRALADTSDRISGRLEPVATGFGRAFGVEKWAVELFAEEVVRGGPAFGVSLVLSSFEPAIRSAAELGAWQLISPGDATGVVEVVNGLHEVQEKDFPVPTVLIAKRVSGEEEIPDGVVALLTPDAPDVLSHVSVRARNMHCIFATCHEAGPLQELTALDGKVISIKTTAAGSVKWELSDGHSSNGNGNGAPVVKKKLRVKVPKWCGKWVVNMDDYREGVVGAKSKNLAGLRGRLPDSIALPASVTIPFGAFEEALKAPENKNLAKQLDDLVASISLKTAESVLGRARQVAMQVVVPQVLQDKLRQAMGDAGIPVPNTPERWDMAMEALKGVWASKFNERAYISMRKVGLDFMSIRMAVLVQNVVPAQYAFVIHTKNPATNDEGEIYAELVRGLGESIVSGQVQGSALAFTARKDNLDNPQVLLYPSKSDGMFVNESLIFRSDSNGEDLEGYAGAGLYDSITMDTTRTEKVDYMTDKVITDDGFRRDLLSRVCKVGGAIEDALGTAQDVEGVVDPQGKITVVQTRPQM